MQLLRKSRSAVVRLVSGAPVLVLALAAALSWLAFEGVRQIRLDTGLVALMPDGVASVENLNKVLDQTGSFASAVVVITSPDPEAAARYAADLRGAVLADLPWVAAAEYSEDLSVFERHKLLYLDTSELQKLRDDISRALQTGMPGGIDAPPDFLGVPVNVHLRTAPPLPPRLRDSLSEIGDAIGQESKTRRFFRSDDGEVTLLVVWPGAEFGGLGGSRRIIEDLVSAAAELDPASYHPDMMVAVGGRIYNRVVQFDAVISDLSVAGSVSISLILLLLAIYFRSLVAVPLIVLPLTIGILWTIGLAGFVIGQLNLITVFLVLILFGLGIDFGIHNLARYGEEKAAGASPQDALDAVFRHTGGASLIAGATTCAGFFALMITDFRAFHEFGFIAGTGILLTFVAMYTVLPALLVLGERLGSGLAMTAPLDATALARPFLQRPGVTMLVIVAMAGLGLWQATGVTFEDDFGKLQAERSPAHKALQANISRVFPDGTDRAVLIVDTLQEVAKIRDYFDAYIARDNDTPTIRKIETFYSFAPLPGEQEARLELIAEIRDLIDRRQLPEVIRSDLPAEWRSYLDIGGMAPADLPEGLRRVFTGSKGTDEGGGHLIYIFNSVSLNRADLARQFADDIRTIEVDGKTYHPAAEGLVFVDMLDLMKGDALKAVAAVIGVTVLLVGLFFRRPRIVAMVLMPSIFGIILLAGIMGIFDIKLSIFNMVILPALIGIGVDNGIHIVHRANEETKGEAQAGAQAGMANALARSGGAAAVTTLTTMLGFAGMLSADMGGLHALGLVATIGFGCCLLATFMTLPALTWIGDKA